MATSCQMHLRMVRKRQILSRLAANFVGWELDSAKFDEAFDVLVRALRPAAHEAESPPEPKL